jgi:hypothetical protein
VPRGRVAFLPWNTHTGTEGVLVVLAGKSKAIVSVESGSACEGKEFHSDSAYEGVTGGGGSTRGEGDGGSLKAGLEIVCDRAVAMLPSHLGTRAKVPGSVLAFPFSSEAHPEETVGKVVGVRSTKKVFGSCSGFVEGAFALTASRHRDEGFKIVCLVEIKGLRDFKGRYEMEIVVVADRGARPPKRRRRCESLSIHDAPK